MVVGHVNLKSTWPYETILAARFGGVGSWMAQICAYSDGGGGSGGCSSASRGVAAALCWQAGVPLTLGWPAALTFNTILHF